MFMSLSRSRHVYTVELHFSVTWLLLTSVTISKLNPRRNLNINLNFVSMRHYRCN